MKKYWLCCPISKIEYLDIEKDEYIKEKMEKKKLYKYYLQKQKEEREISKSNNNNNNE